MNVILVITDTLKEAENMEADLIKKISLNATGYYARSFGMVTMRQCTVIFRTAYEINNGKSFGIIPNYIYNHSMHELDYVSNMVSIGAIEPDCKLIKLVTTLEGIAYVQGKN